jgi:hypothetical protein
MDYYFAKKNAPMKKYKSVQKILLAFVFSLLYISCKEKHSLEDKNSIYKNEFLSYTFGKDVWLQTGGYYCDEKNNILYYSGYIKVGESEESGNYVFDIKNQTILNGHIDNTKSQKSIQDGPTDKNYILGIEREAGVKMYSEYDNDELNQIAKIQIDTTCQTIKLDVKKDSVVLSSLELKNNLILIEKGLPLYQSIESAASDNTLPSGALFKVAINENISALYIKN